MPKATATREAETTPKKPTKDQAKALAWVKKRARSRNTKHTARPEAEGAAIGEPSRPATPPRRRKR